MTDEERFDLLVDMVTGTAAQLAARITIAMTIGGISPNRVKAWMDKFQPPPLIAPMTARTHALILNKCLSEIELYNTLKQAEDDS